MADEQGGIGCNILLLNRFHHGFAGVLVQGPAGGSVAYYPEPQGIQAEGVVLHFQIPLGNLRKSAAILGNAVGIAALHTMARNLVQQRNARLGQGADTSGQEGHGKQESFHCLRHKVLEDLFQLVEVFHQDLPRLGSVLRTHNAGGLQLIHHSACFCITHAKTALQV